MKKHILIAEDDQKLAQLIKEYLEQNGFQLTWEARGDRVPSLVKRLQPDLIILDLMLPGRDGFALCRELRPTFHGPILMFTARQSDIDQVLGLELGADDYVVKPIEPRVLVARINALLRRSQESHEASKASQQDISFGCLTIKPSSQVALLNEQDIELTSHEFELLRYLAERAGTAVSREKIHRDIIGREYDGIDRTVDMRISHLRKKIGDDVQKPERIKTVWGKGYLFTVDSWTS